MPPSPLQIEYRPMNAASELPAVARLIHHAFAGPVEACRKWVEGAGVENMRVALPAGSTSPPPACLLRIPMGQYFGGRSVPMVGIAGVAVAPEARGGGLALEMMKACVREVRTEGVPLSCLYASTQTLYRAVGYEQAGYLFTNAIPIERIGIRDRSLPVRPVTPADEPAIRACYHAWAKATSGMLDRGEYAWGRTRLMRDEAYEGFAIDGAGGSIAGYLFIHQRRNPVTGRHDVAVSDIAWTTGAAAHRLLGFLADFSAIGDTIEIFGGPMHLLLHGMPQQRFISTHKDIWMLRLTDVPSALEARGYPAALSCSFTLDLDDEAIPDNAGAWGVRIENGHATVKREGAQRDAAHMSVQTLASLYSGFLTASQARLFDTVQGSESVVAALDAAFSSGTPTMADRF